ncbi:putative uncharacterized protein [Staphylococcus equorum subsp. equorum Mu2]|mgnify:CR=1 FL=1|nr:putative uncharacterized protein [Staphylococcus equorum subsp. equorum Mu2]
MGNLMMYTAFAFFCILFLIIIFSLLFDISKLGKWIIICTVMILLLSIIVLYRTGADLRRENISTLQYGTSYT